MVCTDKILTLQCQLSDPTRAGDTMYYINIQQRNISELYEDIVTIKNKPVNESVVIWYNDTIEHISSTEESSIYIGSCKTNYHTITATTAPCMKENLFIVDSIHYIVYALTKLTISFFAYSKIMFQFPITYHIKRTAI
jgi:hypothetical protein